MRWVLIISLLFIGPGYADFNRSSGLIDIPRARVLPHYGYRIGLDGSLPLGSGYRNDGVTGNFHSSLGLFDKVEAYLNIYTINNFTAVIGFSHTVFAKEKFALAWGIHEISYALDVSEVGHGDSTGWYDDLTYDYRYGDYEKPFELGSAFIVATYSPNESVESTFGIGRGKYCGYGTHSQYFNSNFYHKEGGNWGIGLFAGLGLKIMKGLSFIIEGDSRDLNFGLKFRYKPIEIGLALTKWEWLFWPGSDNKYNPRLSASISYIHKEEKEKLGVIAGTVFDINDRPIAAEIGFLDKEIPAVMTEAGLGTFVFVNLSPGIYEVYARAKGFKGSVKTIEVFSGKITYCNFELAEEEPKVGDIIGKVIDFETSEPIIARISVTRINLSVESDITGIYEFKGLEPNHYEIMAEADGYETGYYPVVVYAGETSELNISMLKRGMRISLHGVKFDFNKATLKAESHTILNEAATILTIHPDIRVEIQGHTDAVGGDDYNLRLSNARANAVRDYLTNIQRIDPSRLIARGYGEQMPIASNATEEGRAQNRRVDFIILK